MDNSGAFTLGDFSPTTAGTIDGTPVTDLDGMNGFTVQAALSVGDGSDADATATIYIKTSIDQGQRWADVAVLRFSSVGGVLVASVEAESTHTPVAPTTNALADDSNSAVVLGVLGDRLMASVKTTGTFAGQTVCSVRVCVR